MSQIPATRVGVVGCGPRGIGHVRAIQALEGAECIGVCELDAERRAQFEDEVGLPTFERLEDLLSESPEVIGVATNVETHVPVGCAVLEAGIHLAIEKPLAPSAEEARQLVTLAAEKGLQAGVSFQLHYDPFCNCVREVCQEIDPLLVHHARHSGLMRPQFLRPGKFTGVFDYLVHELDLIRWWTQREVVGVTARMGFGTYSDTGTTDLVVLHLDLAGEDCAAATLVGSMAGPPLTRVIQIAGRNGSIEGRFGKELSRGGGPGSTPEVVSVPESTMNGTAALYQDIILTSHGEPAPNMPTLHDGLAAVAVVEAAFQSHEEGRRVEVELG